MAETVYIESSVISYLTARPNRDVVVAARQAITESWWHEGLPQFEAFVSALVVQEVSQGDQVAAERRLAAIADIPLLGTSEEALELAEDLTTQGAVPPNSEEDALHIGIAAASGVGFLLTWNFKHINNAQAKALITSVIEARGYLCPVLCSPEELGA